MGAEKGSPSVTHTYKTTLETLPLRSGTADDINSALPIIRNIP